MFGPVSVCALSIATFTSPIVCIVSNSLSVRAVVVSLRFPEQEAQAWTVGKLPNSGEIEVSGLFGNARLGIRPLY